MFRKAHAAAASALLALAALPACVPEPAVGGLAPDSGVAAGRFSELMENVLVPRCASDACHGGVPAREPPGLAPEIAYGELVGAMSFQAPIAQVTPFDPANSYLVLKIRGTHGFAGGGGSPMPIGDVGLDERDIQAIEAWIANGAPND
jgi:hypothetical protein